MQCLAHGQESHGCSLDDKPEATKVCRNPSCEFRLSALLLACASLHVCVLLQQPTEITFSFLVPLFLGHLPHSCQEVRSTNALSTDGEHLLNVQGKALKVSFYNGITPEMH